MKKRQPVRMSALERKALLEDLAAMVLVGELTFGDALRVLRGGVLRMDRASFAKAVGLSEAAIAKLEDQREANPTLETLTKVFRPFGAELGLVFPRLEERDPPSEEQRRTREGIRAALEGARRKRRSAP